MTKLPVVSGQDVIRALGKIGYAWDHQKRSHIVLRNQSSPFRRITMPNHKEISRGTLKSILRETGLTSDEFARLL